MASRSRDQPMSTPTEAERYEDERVPIVKRTNLLLAVKNIAEFGDTDVFPFPIENLWFKSEPDVVTKLLEQLDDDFDGWCAQYPVACERLLASVGYVGFRAATQIDPVWNAYLLGLVLELATDIEASRIPTQRNRVFSYRFRPDQTGRLFDTDIGWTQFHEVALRKAQSRKFVMTTDISDFYSRVYHHRLENALSRTTQNKSAVKRIDTVLFKLADQKSYGLPVGGNAARLLAEVLLHGVDRLLENRGVDFVRYVDDYIIFGDTRAGVQKSLVVLAEALHRNESPRVSRRAQELGEWESWDEEANSRRRCASAPCDWCSTRGRATTRSGQPSVRWPRKSVAVQKRFGSGSGKPSVTSVSVVA